MLFSPRPSMSVSSPRARPHPVSVSEPTPAIRPSSQSLALGRHPGGNAGRQVVPLSPSSPLSPLSPLKRKRVLFDESRNETLEANAVMNLQQVKQNIRTVLELRIRGVSEPYDELKARFPGGAKPEKRSVGSPEAVPDLKCGPEISKEEMIALISCAPLLKDKSCNCLVRLVLKLPWLGRDERFINVYIQFLAALVSSQSLYLFPVLQSLVGSFVAKRSAWTLSEYPEVGRKTAQDRTHAALHYLLRLFPATRDLLRRTVSDNFPSPADPLRSHMAFVENLIRLMRYAPDMEHDLLDLIVHRLVQMDVQMQIDLEDLDDDISTAVVYALKETPVTSNSWEDDEDDEVDESDTESVLTADLQDHYELARVKAVKELVEKLDAIMDALFGYFAPHFVDPSSDEAYDYFAVLVRQFKSILLPTTKSRHTQFLLFHFGQQSERLLDAAVGTYVETAFKSNSPMVLRDSATLYLASFVARGALVPGDLVRGIFRELIMQLNGYCNRYEKNCRGPDLRRFSPFYTLFQAVSYMFCYRWRDLVISTPPTVDPEDPASYIGQELEWIPHTREVLRRCVYSRLNPLKVCSPAIVNEFARLAQRLQFLYVYDRIEANRRLRLSQYLCDSYENGGALRDSATSAFFHDETRHQLDTYFPFDPYQLPTSRRWVESEYMSWTPVPGLTTDQPGSDEEDGAIGDDSLLDLDEDTATDGNVSSDDEG